MMTEKTLDGLAKKANEAAVAYRIAVERCNKADAQRSAAYDVQVAAAGALLEAQGEYAKERA